MRNILLCFFLIIAQQVVAQSGSFVQLKNLTSFKEKFSTASQQLQSVESDFVQVKNLSLLKDKITSSGKFYYKKGNKVRIEYTKPFTYLMVINENAVMVKDEQKKSNFNASSNRIMKSINSIMIDCMSGNVLNNKEFVTTVLENPKEYLLSLTPSSNLMKKMFSKIEVFVSKIDYNVLRLNMVENGGDNSLMTFNNRIINKSLDEKLFSTK